MPSIAASHALPWVLGSSLFSIIACSDASDSMHSWIGHGGDELVQVWGQPSEDTGAQIDGRLITYISYWSMSFSHTNTCRRVFTTDGQGIIRTVSALGCQKGS